MTDVDRSLCVAILSSSEKVEIQQVVSEESPVEIFASLFDVGRVFVGDDGSPETSSTFFFVLNFNRLGQPSEFFEFFLQIARSVQ